MTKTPLITGIIGQDKSCLVELMSRGCSVHVIVRDNSSKAAS